MSKHYVTYDKWRQSGLNCQNCGTHRYKGVLYDGDGRFFCDDHCADVFFAKSGEVPPEALCWNVYREMAISRLWWHHRPSESGDLQDFADLLVDRLKWLQNKEQACILIGAYVETIVSRRMPDDLEVSATSEMSRLVERVTEVTGERLKCRPVVNDIEFPAEISDKRLRALRDIWMIMRGME